MRNRNCYQGTLAWRESKQDKGYLNCYRLIQIWGSVMKLQFLNASP